MERLSIGDQEVAVVELTSKVENDVVWLTELLQAIQAELLSKQNLLVWLGKEPATCSGAQASNVVSLLGRQRS